MLRILLISQEPQLEFKTYKIIWFSIYNQAKHRDPKVTVFPFADINHIYHQQLILPIYSRYRSVAPK